MNIKHYSRLGHKIRNMMLDEVVAQLHDEKIGLLVAQYYQQTQDEAERDEHRYELSESRKHEVSLRG